MSKDVVKLVKTLRLPLFGALLLTTLSSLANEKWYHVEVIVIEAKDKSALAEEWPLNPGKPSMANAIELGTDSATDFSLLKENELTLGRAKKRLQQHYRLVMHKGWRQMLSDKENATSIHLLGGQQFSDSLAENKGYEVDGMIKLSGGKFINVDADLLFHKPIKLVSPTNPELPPSENTEGTARFAEVSLKNWKNEFGARLQAFRLKESSRLKADEMHYIDHPLYGIIIVVSPEKSAV
ncbi:CsiV family protein [Candidatus Berkiella aquae]|uniref:Peptidoglycan binding protein CsiV n=1 Tax=Candidatus Berkiella aquae TaxID=295108 RepID=A0A0Q9Z1A8_9GAMM|nr:CsiV family protein [Candidatus Berkiella aquae]MCS5711807.1 peptidoglycan binding protein CsiV [Candidatus Berkiella aquae]